MSKKQILFDNPSPILIMEKELNGKITYVYIYEHEKYFIESKKELTKLPKPPAEAFIQDKTHKDHARVKKKHDEFHEKTFMHARFIKPYHDKKKILAEYKRLGWKQFKI